jgi:hypothetical protein
MSRKCPLSEVVLVHVVQVEAPIMQEYKQLHEYNTPNIQDNSRPNG